MLNELSKKQVELISQKRDQWLDNFFKTGDEFIVEKFHAGVDFLYEISGLKVPIKVYVDSPLGMQYACEILKNLKKSKQVEQQVGQQVWLQVRQQVWQQVRQQVEQQVEQQVWQQVRQQVWLQVGQQVRQQVEQQVEQQVWQQVRQQVWLQVGQQVGQQVWQQVWQQVQNFEKYSYNGIAWDSGWVSFYDYFQEIGIVKSENIEKYKDFLASGAYDTILFENFAIGCRKPSYILRDTNFRMHSEDKAAIAWRDGFELYYIHGVNFNKELWERAISRRMSFDEVLAIKDIDQRWVAMKLLGDKMLNGVKEKELLDKSEKGNELWLIKNLFPSHIDAFFARYVCPSTGRVYFSGIDPEVGKKGDADEALAWKHNLSKSDYLSLTKET